MITGANGSIISAQVVFGRVNEKFVLPCRFLLLEETNKKGENKKILQFCLIVTVFVWFIAISRKIV